MSIDECARRQFGPSESIAAGRSLAVEYDASPLDNWSSRSPWSGCRDPSSTPERIAQEWWKGDIDDVRVGHVRDYYRVEDEAGARFWLFRAGLYEAGSRPSWWLHGLFG